MGVPCVSDDIICHLLSLIFQRVRPGAERLMTGNYQFKKDDRHFEKTESAALLVRGNFGRPKGDVQKSSEDSSSLLLQIRLRFIDVVGEKQTVREG